MVLRITFSWWYITWFWATINFLVSVTLLSILSGLHNTVACMASILHQITNVVYCTAIQTTKDSLIYKHIIYIFILRRWHVWSRNTIRKISHISFFCGGDPLCVLERRPENIHDMFAWVTAGLALCLKEQWVSPFDWKTSRPLPLFERPADLSLSLSDQWISTFSPNLQTLYCLFKSRAEVLTSFSPLAFLWVVIWIYILRSFPVICWSYLRTEISVTLSIGNKSYSFSCETTKLVLSCDRIESAKFIVAS